MKYSVFFIFLFIFNSSVGQDTAAVTKTDVQDGDFLLGLQFGLPGEQMKKAVHNKMADIGFGGTICYLTNPLTWGKKKRNSPIRLGGELAYTYYGRFISDVNIGGYQGSYKTSYGILNLNAIFRLRPPKVAPVVPFADLIVGGNFYISRTKENLDALESALGVETTDFGGYSSSSFNKGIGAGLSFGSAKAREARFVLRVTCNWGSDIKYVVRNSVTYDPGNNKLNYEIGKAPVKYFLIQLGVGL